MSSQPSALSGYGAAGPSMTTTGQPSASGDKMKTEDGDKPRQEWDPERQIVSSLWKLQELETNVST
jgi:hypothetical protein